MNVPPRQPSEVDDECEWSIVTDERLAAGPTWRPKQDVFDSIGLIWCRTGQSRRTLSRSVNRL